MAVEDFWASFLDDSIYQTIEFDDYGSLAPAVLRYFSIPCNEATGGSLANLDIKHMDAMTVVKLSLLEQSAIDGTIYEPVVDENGYVQFERIGAEDGGVIDIYYTVQSMTYKEECAGVMVQGGKPLPTRRNVEPKPIWGDGDKTIYDATTMVTNCMDKSFSQYAMIVFNDPHLTTGQSGFEDGIDNLYEHGINGDFGPYDVIIGYAIYKEPPEGMVSPTTSIKYVETCAIPILVSKGEADSDGFGNANLGILVKPIEFDPQDENKNCWAGDIGVSVDPEQGIKVPIPEEFRYETMRGQQIDKFLGIESVFVVGMEADPCRSVPKNEAAAVSPSPSPEDCLVVAHVQSKSKILFKCVEGQHYALAYKDTDGILEPYIVFADKSRNDPATFGTDTEYLIPPFCNYSLNKELIKGAYKVGAVLPITPERAIIVEEVWAMVRLQTPAIEVYDPPYGDLGGGGGASKGKAKAIAEGLNYMVYPLVTVDEPSPVAYNGRVLDMIAGIKDHDPTTTQDFEDTEYEIALDEMAEGGGGLSLSLPFLNEEGCAKLSGSLYEYMNSGDGIETTYTCGPSCTPKLGGNGPSGGIVNSITYSYSDKSSYTISITEGAKFLNNFTQVSGGPHFKMAEDVQAQGTVVQDLGNSIHYKIRIDGFGDRLGISQCPDIIRVGDKVSCCIHNCPIED